MSEKLTKSERLRGEKRIEALFLTGRRGSSGPLRFCWTATANGAADNLSSQARHEVPTRDQPDVSVLFSVPKKIFKRAWARNLIKRRMRESYRRSKGALAEAATRSGVRIDIALICSPDAPKPQPETPAHKPKNAPRPRPEVPDFKTIDNAINRILEQIAARVQ